MLDFIEKEFQIFKPSEKILNNDIIPNTKINNKQINQVMNNTPTNKNILINPKIMSNISNLTNSKNQSLSIHMKKSIDQPIIPNSQISNIKYKLLGMNSSSFKNMNQSDIFSKNQTNEKNINKNPNLKDLKGYNNMREFKNDDMLKTSQTKFDMKTNVKLKEIKPNLDESGILNVTNSEWRTNPKIAPFTVNTKFTDAMNETNITKEIIGELNKTSNV